MGRPGTPVPPGGLISKVIEHCVPAGRPFGQIHDERVDLLRRQGYPDLRANVPSMPGAYADAVRQEANNSLRPFIEPFVEWLLDLAGSHKTPTPPTGP